MKTVLLALCFFAFSLPLWAEEPVCQKEKKIIEETIKEFQKFQKERNNGIFVMMTRPKLPQDIEVFFFLMGMDGGVGPRLYTTGTTDYQLEDFRVKYIASSEELAFTTLPGLESCAARVEESRKYNSHGPSTKGIKLKKVVTCFHLVKVESVWKIESYSTDDQGKYSGFTG